MSDQRKSMAERSGDPELDALIEEYLSNEHTPMYDYWRASDYMTDARDPESAAGMCDIAASDFVDFLRHNGISATTSEEWSQESHKYIGKPGFLLHPEQLGYEGQFEDFENHCATVVEMPSGTYMVDFTASQYGHTEFPMVQRLGDEGQWQRQWEARTANESRVMYHVSPTTNRQNIQQNGLALGHASPWQGLSVGDIPQGIYFWTSANDAEEYVHTIGQDSDIWAVDVAGLDLIDDPQSEDDGPVSRYTINPVSPARLQLLDTIQAQDWEDRYGKTANDPSINVNHQDQWTHPANEHTWKMPDVTQSGPATDPSQLGSHWAYLNGEVAFGNAHYPLIRELGMSQGLDPNQVVRMENEVARGGFPSGTDLAIGTMRAINGKLRPNIWQTTVDRNHVWDTVNDAFAGKMANPITPSAPEETGYNTRRFVGADSHTDTTGGSGDVGVEIFPLTHGRVREAMGQAGDLPPIKIVVNQWAPTHMVGRIPQEDYYPSIEAVLDGQVIGRLDIEDNPELDGTYEIANIKVHPLYRRMGVATALLNYARENYGVVNHAPEPNRSDDGLAWSQSVGRVREASTAVWSPMNMRYLDVPATAGEQERSKRLQEIGAYPSATLMPNAYTANGGLLYCPGCVAMNQIDGMPISRRGVMNIERSQQTKATCHECGNSLLLDEQLPPQQHRQMVERSRTQQDDPGDLTLPDHWSRVRESAEQTVRRYIVNTRSIFETEPGEVWELKNPYISKNTPMYELYRNGQRDGSLRVDTVQMYIKKGYLKPVPEMPEQAGADEPDLGWGRLRHPVDTDKPSLPPAMQQQIEQMPKRQGSWYYRNAHIHQFGWQRIANEDWINSMMDQMGYGEGSRPEWLPDAHMDVRIPAGHEIDSTLPIQAGQSLEFRTRSSHWDSPDAGREVWLPATVVAPLKTPDGHSYYLAFGWPSRHYGDEWDKQPGKVVYLNKDQVRPLTSPDQISWSEPEQDYYRNARTAAKTQAQRLREAQELAEQGFHDTSQIVQSSTHTGMATYEDWQGRVKPSRHAGSEQPWQMTPEEFAAHPNTLWHGTPTGEIGSGPHMGVHFGTQKAAYQALRAKLLGQNADLYQGTGWEWQPGMPLPIDESKGHWEGEAMDKHSLDPKIHPVWLHPERNDDMRPLHEEYPESDENYGWSDSKANAFMRRQRKRGEESEGYWYSNIAEDPGSISGVVPNRSWLMTHEDFVRDALARGESVPSEVLKAYPHLRRQSKIAMAERTGDPKLDALIDQFMDKEVHSYSEDKKWRGMAPLEQWATIPGFCVDVAGKFRRWMEAQGHPAELYRNRPDNMGYADRPSKGQLGDYPADHAAVIVKTPSGTFMVDFTAKQFGYSEFPMVQKLDDVGGWQRQWQSSTHTAMGQPSPCHNCSDFGRKAPDWDPYSETPNPACPTCGGIGTAIWEKDLPYHAERIERGMIPPIELTDHMEFWDFPRLDQFKQMVEQVRPEVDAVARQVNPNYVGFEAMPIQNEGEDFPVDGPGAVMNGQNAQSPEHPSILIDSSMIFASSDPIGLLRSSLLESVVDIAKTPTGPIKAEYQNLYNPNSWNERWYPEVGEGVVAYRGLNLGIFPANKIDEIGKKITALNGMFKQQRSRWNNGLGKHWSVNQEASERRFGLEGGAPDGMLRVAVLFTADIPPDSIAHPDDPDADPWEFVQVHDKTSYEAEITVPHGKPVTLLKAEVLLMDSKGKIRRINIHLPEDKEKRTFTASTHTAMGLRGDLPEGLEFTQRSENVFGGDVMRTEAVLGGEVIGFIEVWIRQRKLKGRIREIYVKPEYRRMGVASALYEQAGRPQHSRDLTDEGQAWSQHVGAWKMAESIWDDPVMRDVFGWIPEQPQPTPEEKAQREKENRQRREEYLQAMLHPDSPDTLMQYAEQVPIKQLQGAMEFDRRPDAAGNQAADPEYWDRLKQSIQQYGISSPIILQYNPDTGEAYISEGNHRLGIAKELGMTHVPIVVYRSRQGVGQGGAHIKLNPYPQELRGVGDYVPQYIQPSQVGLRTAHTHEAWKVAHGQQCMNCGSTNMAISDGSMMCKDCGWAGKTQDVELTGPAGSLNARPMDESGTLWGYSPRHNIAVSLKDALRLAAHEDREYIVEPNGDGSYTLKHSLQGKRNRWSPEKGPGSGELTFPELEAVEQYQLAEGDFAKYGYALFVNDYNGEFLYKVIPLDKAAGWEDDFAKEIGWVRLAGAEMWKVAADESGLPPDPRSFAEQLADSLDMSGWQRIREFANLNPHIPSQVGDQVYMDYPDKNGVVVRVRSTPEDWERPDVFDSPEYVDQQIQKYRDELEWWRSVDTPFAREQERKALLELDGWTQVEKEVLKHAQKYNENIAQGNFYYDIQWPPEAGGQIGTFVEPLRVWPVGYLDPKVHYPDRFSSRKVSEDYRMQHQPFLEGPFIHNMEEMFPADIYDKPHWYGADPRYDWGADEAVAALRKAKGNPDAMITIYRAVPPGVTSINTGDWITTSKKYAEGHAAQHYDPRFEEKPESHPVLSASVPAKYIATGGSDVMEWGYTGPTIQNAQRVASTKTSAIRVFDTVRLRPDSPLAQWVRQNVAAQWGLGTVYELLPDDKALVVWDNDEAYEVPLTHLEAVDPDAEISSVSDSLPEH